MVSVMRASETGLRRNLTALILAACCSYLLLAPVQVLATCCKCHPPTDPTANICLTISGTNCPTTLSGTTCDSTTYTDDQCKLIADGGFCGNLSDASAYQVPNSKTIKGTVSSMVTKALNPKLGVDIPGLTISPVTQSNGQVIVPFIAQYVAGVYRYASSIAIIAAALMIVYGGFLYILGSSIKSISTGKQHIIDAVIGLILLLGSYALLNLVNPTLVNPKPILLQTVIPKDFSDMLDMTGFSDSYAVYPPGSNPGSNNGSAPRLPPPGTYAQVQGENPNQPTGKMGQSVLIQGIVPTGNGSQRIRAFCTTRADAANLKSYDEKIPALVRAVLGFKQICIDEKSCAYVRTGFTDLNSGKVIGGGSDAPFLVRNITNIIGISPIPWDSDCQDEWNAIGGSKGFYDLYKPPNSDPKVADFDWSNGGGKCYNQIKQVYDQKFVDVLSNHYILGGDCGSTMAQIYRCAGAQIGGGDNFQNIVGWAKLPTDSPLFIVRNAKSMDDFDSQLANHGGPKFGDIIVAGNLSTNHNFMFTGGRDDVPFDLFEMGGGQGLDGTSVVGVQVSTKGWDIKQNPIGGMRIQGVGGNVDDGTKNLHDYVDSYAAKGNRWPVSVIRPYQFTTCQSRSECKDGEACKCTALDAGNWGNNKCGLANTCHKGKPGTYCNEDEQCINPMVCDTAKHICVSPPAASS